MVDEALTGKVAVVTGAAGGLEDAVAQALAGAGADVVGLDRERADLSVADEVESFFAGPDRLDVFFNGAGILARLPELQPLTGKLGRPEDVAGAALYLATAPFVTGTVLVVDGGWTAK